MALVPSAAVDLMRSALGVPRARSRILRARLSREATTLLTWLNRHDAASPGHSSAVAALAVEVGRQLGLAEGPLRQLEVGALLHDVGKLEVPQAILEKTGPLTRAEWAFMRAHPEAGERMLSSVGEPDVLAVVRSHHERFDGRGYPDGASGDSIPLPARIVAVADAFQAMIEPRPYRPARSKNAAIGELKANAGTQFDPRCVSALVGAVAVGRASA
jgi:putative nucleotidyltransferase with HDIG domain